MTAYRFGDILLIGFPHTDLRSVSKRPALVLYDSGDRDVLVARVTSQRHDTPADYEIVDWRKAGLVVASEVRLGKLATLEKRHIVRPLGTLGQSEIEALKSILRRLLAL